MVRVTNLTNEHLENFLQMIETHEGKERKIELQTALNNLKDNEDYLVCIDCESGLPIGYSKTTTLTHGLIKLDYIYVIPTLRRETNGSIILVAVYNKAVNRLTAGIVCECDQENQTANAFFKSRGFILSGENDGVNYYTKSLMHMYIKHTHDE